MSGTIICFEGIDGTGKTTQALKFKQYFEEKKIPVIYVKMGKGYLEDKIQEINKGNLEVPLSTRSLLYAANMDHIDKTIVQPSVKEGKIVLLDRQFLTLVIYGTLRNKDQAWIENINSKLTKPDITFVLLSNPEDIVKYRNKKIGIFETVKENLDEANDRVNNYISLQNEVSDFYKKFVNNKDIFEINTEAGIEETFKRIHGVLNEKLGQLTGV